MEQSAQNILIGVYIGIVVFLIFFVMFLYFKEQKKNRQIAKQLEESLKQNQGFIVEMQHNDALQKTLLDRLLINTSTFDDIDATKAKLDTLIQQAQAKVADTVGQILQEEETNTKMLEGLLREAQKKSQDIASEAVANAQAIIVDKKKFDETLDKQTTSLMSESANEAKTLLEQKITALLTSYQTTIAEQQKQHINLLQSINKDIQEKALKQTNEALSSISQRVIELGNQKREYMEKEMAAIQSQLDQYKKEQLSKIESNIYEILARASESVIGQAVNLDLHQELIIKALEQAKREGVFI